MNNKKYFSSEQENEDHSMEWEEDEGIGACVGEDGTSSFDPNVASGYAFSLPITSGYAFSQPSTSGYTGQKRKSSFSSPPPAKISRNIWNGQEHPSINETNLCNNREVASGFDIASLIPQMIQVGPPLISSQATSDNTSAVLVKDDTDCYKGDISTDSMHVTDPDDRLNRFLGTDELREKIIRLLDAEGPMSETEATLSDIERLEFLYVNEKRFSNNFSLPKRSREALRRHLRHHGVNGISDNFGYFQGFIPLGESNCMICRIFFGFLAHPNLLPESDF